MFETRGRKIWRDIVARKARTALVSTSIFIGVLGVVALFSMGDILIRRLDETIDKDKLAMVTTYTIISTDEPLDNDAYIQALSELPEVTAVQGTIRSSMYWRKADEADFREARLFAYSSPFEALPLEPVDLYQGQFPVAGQQQLAIERRLANKYNLSVGDSITVRILGDSTASPNDIQEETWTVVGIIFQPHNYPYAPGAPVFIEGENMLFAAQEDVEHITGGRGFNSFQLRYTDYAAAQAHSAEVEKYITTQTPYRPFTTVLDDPAKNAFLTQVESFRNVLSLLAIVALLISGFLVFNIVNNVVVEQRQQIGILKSIGSTRQDIFFIYAGISLIYGIIGVIPGVLLGVPFGFRMVKGLAPTFNIFIDRFQVSPTAIITGILLGVVVPVLASAIPVWQGTKVSILEAITDLGISSAAPKRSSQPLLDPSDPLSSLLRLLGLPFSLLGTLLAFLLIALPVYLLNLLPLPISLRQALRNIDQKRGRLILTIGTLSLAAGAFMGVTAMLSSLRLLTDNIFNTFGNDITFVPNGNTDFENVSQLVKDEVSTVQTVDPAVSVAVEIPGYKPIGLGAAPANLFAFGINTYDPDIVNFDLRSGTAWENDPERHGVVITNGIADALDKDTGDKLSMRIGATDTEFEIIGVVNYPFPSMWFEWHDLAQVGGITAGAPLPNQYFTMVKVNGQMVNMVGIDETPKALLTFSAGEFYSDPASEVIVTDALAQTAGYQVGDKITLVAGEQQQEVTITGIFSLPPEFVSQPQAAIAMDWQTLAALEGKSLTDGMPIPNIYSIIVKKDKPTGEDIAQTINDINQVLLAHGIKAEYNNWAKTAEYVNQLINTASALLNIAVILIGLVGAIGLLSTLSMSVFERQKEIGVMRSVGATSSTVAVQFLVEGLMVGIIAWTIGLPISLWLNGALADAFNFGSAAGISYPVITPVFGLVVMLLLTAISSLSPSLAAARKTVSEILRYQ